MIRSKFGFWRVNAQRSVANPMPRFPENLSRRPSARKFRLRSLLVLLACIAFAPGVVVIAHTFSVIQADELVNAKRELAAVASLVIANQMQLIEGERQLLATVASGPSLRRPDLRDLCEDFLRNVLAAAPGNVDIGFMDSRGEVQCQGNKFLRSGALLRGYFPKAIERDQIFVGGSVLGHENKKMLGFGVPVQDYSGEQRGIAYALLDLEYLNRQLQSISLSSQLEVNVTDGEGQVLASSVNSSKGSHAVSDAGLKAAVLRHAEADLVATDAAGVEWIHRLQPASGPEDSSIMVTVSARKSDMNWVANFHFREQLFMIFLVSLLGLLAAWGFAQRYLARPVAQLLERMRWVEQGGTLKGSLPTSSKNVEFSQLNEGLSSMLGRLEKNQQQLTKAQQISRIGFYQLDMQAGSISATPVVYEILGLDPAIGPLSTEQYESMIHPEDRQLVNQQSARLFAEGEPLRMQYRVVRPDESVRWIDAYGYIQKDDPDKPILYTGAIHDITDRRQAEQVRRVNENQFRLLFENSLDGVLQTSADGAILRANPSACRIFGLKEAQLIGLGRDDLALPGDVRLEAFLKERDATGHARGTVTLVRGDGSQFEAELASSVYKDDAGNFTSSLILRDISQRIKAEERIHSLAYFDALTGLPNRRLLMDRLGLLYAVSERQKQFGAVLFIDLDHFKNVNDARGHETGDALLQQVARRLSSLMRSQDTVARIGGDEFVILLPDLATNLSAGAQHAMGVAEKVLEELMQPLQVNGQPYRSSASIGVTLFPKTSQSAQDLLREADTAMYRAKHAGRNQIAFFEASMQASVEERLSLEDALAQAIDTPQLELFLQPQIDYRHRAAGCELLVRWTHPALGVLSPAMFIPIAEETDLICRLGEWVLREGCKTLLRLQEVHPSMTVSINVSPRQFHQARFVEKVRAILDETGAPACQLIFEITEGVLFNNLDDSVARMNELTAMGIRFSIDDFGTGYSSLAYLQRLPLYELKIDRSFVHGTPHEKGATSIVQSILALAKNLGFKVVAEGVETREQADFLRLAGCDLLQGYLFAPPGSVDFWLTKLDAMALNSR